MIDFHKFTGKIWHADVEVHLPYTFGWDVPFVMRVETQINAKQPIVVCIDDLKKRFISSNDPGEIYVRQFLDELGTQWGLDYEVWANNKTISYDLPSSWNSYGGVKAFLLEEIIPGKDLLLCTGSKGDRGRSPLMGVLYKTAIIAADNQIRELFTAPIMKSEELYRIY